MKESTGRITITRSSNNVINITINDGTNGKRLLKLEMTPEEFAGALFGSAEQPCAMQYFENCPVGKVRQTTQVHVPIDAEIAKSPHDKVEIIETLIKDYAWNKVRISWRDGWALKTDVLDSRVWHEPPYVIKQEGYPLTSLPYEIKAVFERFVDPEEEAGNAATKE